MIDKGICDKGFTRNLSNCKCKCNKLCDFGEYLGYVSCKCRKRLVNKLAEECTENVKKTKVTGNLDGVALSWRWN